MRETPVGSMNGAILHANFAEALLDSRTCARIYTAALHASEIAFGAAASIVFALSTGLLRMAGCLVAVTGLLIGVQWLMLQLSGV